MDGGSGMLKFRFHQCITCAKRAPKMQDTGCVDKVHRYVKIEYSYLIVIPSVNKLSWCLMNKLYSIPLIVPVLG